MGAISVRRSPSQGATSRNHRKFGVVGGGQCSADASLSFGAAVFGSEKALRSAPLVRVRRFHFVVCALSRCRLMPADKWRPLHFERQCCISGGNNARGASWPLPVVQVTVPGGSEEEFVRISKVDHWFLKTIGGPGTQRGHLTHLSFLDELADKAKKHALKVALPEGESAVADESEFATPEGKSEHDPMDDLDDVGSAEKGGDLQKKHCKRKRAIPTHLKVCEIQFRKMPTSEETTKVSCLWTGKFFHVHMSDLDWLLEFAFVSHQKHGSEEVVGDPDGREAGGASAVAGASWRARWKVDPPTWEAEASSGPADGVICSCRIDQFDKDKYAKVKESHDLSDHYAKLSKTRKKEAALLYLKDHMEAKGYVLSC